MTLFRNKCLCRMDEISGLELARCPLIGDLCSGVQVRLVFPVCAPVIDSKTKQWSVFAVWKQLIGFIPQGYARNSLQWHCQTQCWYFLTNYEAQNSGQIYRSRLVSATRLAACETTLTFSNRLQSCAVFMHWLSVGEALAVNWKGWWPDSLMIAIIFSALAVTFSQRSTGAIGLLERTVFYCEERKLIW